MNVLTAIFVKMPAKRNTTGLPSGTGSVESFCPFHEKPAPIFSHLMTSSTIGCLPSIRHRRHARLHNPLRPTQTHTQHTPCRENNLNQIFVCVVRTVYSIIATHERDRHVLIQTKGLGSRRDRSGEQGYEFNDASVRRYVHCFVWVCWLLVVDM
jgi:hypothetical protein